MINQELQDFYNINYKRFQRAKNYMSGMRSSQIHALYEFLKRPIKVKFKKLNDNAVIPSYAKLGDAGLDLTAVSKSYSKEYGYTEYGTGLAIQIPKGYVGLLFPRSSISKTFLTLANSVGVLDSGYRGEITFRFFQNTEMVIEHLEEEEVLLPRPLGNSHNTTYKIGDRIGQLLIIPYPQIELEEVDELDQSERGTKGYGSSGN